MAKKNQQPEKQRPVVTVTRVRPKVTREPMTWAPAPCQTIYVAGGATAAKEIQARLARTPPQGDACAVGVSRLTLPLDADGVVQRRSVAEHPELMASTKGEPCRDAMKRTGCPLQLAIRDGQPFLRFCFAKKQPGYRVDVTSPLDARDQAARTCAAWEAGGKTFAFDPAQPLGRGGWRRRRR